MKQIVSIIGVTSLLALGGCVQSHWEKPSVTAEAASADLTECRRSAQREAFRQVDRYGYAGAPMWRYSPGDPLWSRASYEQWASGERLRLQTRLTDQCMRLKGYDRVVDQPS
jgi:hypothetical protein